MRIAVVGGYGTVGAQVVRELGARGFQGDDVRVLSRSSASFPVDLTTGAGLADALAGVDVVVDAVNAKQARAAARLRRREAAGRRGGGRGQPPRRYCLWHAGRARDDHVRFMA